MNIQKTNQRLIYKLKSDRLRKNNWSLKLDINEALDNDELVPLADSQALRFIYDINGKDVDEENDQIGQLRKELKIIKKEPFSLENRKKIKNIYKTIYSTLFVEDYISVEFKTKADFDRACSENGFFINNKKFVKIVGTPAGIKKRTIVFISARIYDEFKRRLINGAKDVEIIPAKLEAYRALTFSSSTPMPNTRGILVVNDWETNFTSDITEVGDEGGEFYVRSIKNAPMSLEDSDGYGAISPSFSQKWTESIGLGYISTGFVIRNSYCKGSLFTFDFHAFAKEIAGKEEVEDVWGQVHNINDIDIIMPVSMMKLWYAYDSIDDYLDNCELNGYDFAVTKVIPQKLENYRDTNYQFIQSLRLTDEQIRELIQPTINEIHDALGGDYRKSLLFLRGCDMNERNVWDKHTFDYTKALMIEPKMIDDPFVRQSIHKMIKKRIREAKTGVIRIKGNFSIISGDIYGFMEYVFGMKNPKGLLKAGEFYSGYWNEKGVDKVTAFRAPQTCHENIKIMNLKNTDQMKKWYKYMTCCTIFNAWDCSCHTLNGADK